MRILIYGINYAPELTGIGKYTSEMAEWLAAHGHQVRVVTAPPYYPMWKIGEGFSGWRYSYSEQNGVKVYRCPLWVPSRLSGINRIAHLASFAISSLPVVLWQGLFWQPDVVWVVEPPLLCGPGAWLTARLSGAKAWLHVQDFEVDAVFSLGLLAPSRLQFFVSILERELMRRFDHVSTISRHMLERLKAKGVDDSRCLFFPNWVDTHVIYPLSEPSLLRTRLGLTPDTVVALYAGNMGEKQGLEILIDAAHLLMADAKIQFILCGDGAARSRLQKLAERLPNIRFLPLQPVDHLNELLNLADIHLLPQRADAADLVMPSKLTGMLASGRPVVTTAYRHTELARVVKGCGVVVPPGDKVALAEAIHYLAKCPRERIRLGQAGRAFAVMYWDREKVLRQFEKLLSCG